MPRQCPCGREFDMLKLHDEPDFQSFAFINDDGYEEVLLREVEMMQEPDSAKRFDMLAENAGYIGNAFICPDCGRLHLLKPKPDDGGEWDWEIFQRE